MLFKEVYYRGDIMDNTTYTFKEICEKTGYKSSVIRYYEKEFKLNIERDTNGRRIFSKKDLDKLLFIRGLQQEGYTNGQIKRIINDNCTIPSIEAAAALDIPSNPQPEIEIIKLIEEKFTEINNNLSELNQNVTSRERDIILSENLKLKMEIKQKSYEVIELKEKLRYEKEKNSGFLKRFFKKARIYSLYVI